VSVIVTVQGSAVESLAEKLTNWPAALYLGV
jgi:hypothetical protein